MKEQIETDWDICSSYEYNFHKERAYCYFWERYLTEEDGCPCEYYSVVEGGLEDSFDNPLTESIFEDEEENKNLS